MCVVVAVCRIQWHNNTVKLNFMIVKDITVWKKKNAVGIRNATFYRMFGLRNVFTLIIVQNVLCFASKWYHLFRGLFRFRLYLNNTVCWILEYWIRDEGVAVTFNIKYKTCIPYSFQRIVPMESFYILSPNKNKLSCCILLHFEMFIWPMMESLGLNIHNLAFTYVNKNK